MQPVDLTRHMKILFMDTRLHLKRLLEFETRNSDHLQELENNLPLDDKYKSKYVAAAPIHVIQLIYNSGDVKGPQTVAFNLPNDERMVKERGTAMVMLKIWQRLNLGLLPITDTCISEEQKKYVYFESMFTHTVCHECFHRIGPHTIELTNGKQSTVRMELRELHSALEEAKADMVGLRAIVRMQPCKPLSV